jgi:peptidoglycan/xylan/chitin deacetylase (PgdA/CDA1 family)
MAISRRSLLGGAVAFTGGALTTLGAGQAAAAYTQSQHLPLKGGYAPGTHDDRRTAPRHSRSSVYWAADTSQKLVALTFDDGPMPQWTPEVLRALDEHKAPATFFMVGEHARAHRKLVHGRLARHEVGNHSWEHLDLAKLDYPTAYRDLRRAHAAIVQATGHEPRLLRPPYGHIAGSTMLAAAELGYQVVLWSVQMLESTYASHPAGLVGYIADAVKPGSIVLAHDTGPGDRLVAIRNLPRMITGLRAKGYEFVTVSDLLAAAGTPVPLAASGSGAVRAAALPR